MYTHLLPMTVEKHIHFITTNEKLYLYIIICSSVFWQQQQQIHGWIPISLFGWILYLSIFISHTYTLSSTFSLALAFIFANVFQRVVCCVKYDDNEDNNNNDDRHFKTISIDSLSNQYLRIQKERYTHTNSSNHSTTCHINTTMHLAFDLYEWRHLTHNSKITFRKIPWQLQLLTGSYWKFLTA